MSIRTPKDPVLVVEDDELMHDVYRDIFSIHNIEFEIAENGKIALDLIKRRDFSIFITDLNMPLMGGREFILELKKIKQDPLILVETGNNDPGVIIDIMKLGVFDYIIKPFDVDQFTKVLKKGLEFKYAREQERNLSIHASEKLRGQIEWLNYKENLRIKDKSQSTLRNLSDLKRSFLEGASIGSVMSIILVIKDMMQETEDGYLIDKDIMKTLFDCNDIVKHQFDGIYDITQILKNLNIQEIPVNEFISELPKMVERLEPHLIPKNVTINFPILKSNSKIQVDKEAFSLAFEELVINAYKYTVANSTIFILAYISDGYLVISIKNDVNQKPYGGIPKEYEKIVIEPFIRLHNNDEKMYIVEKFGLGLGLTVVDNIIKKHNGIFFIHDINDYTSKTMKICVVAEIFLPLI